MTDQTRHGIEEIQSQNKARAHAEQKTMREELKKFIDDCGIFHLQELHAEYKRMTRNKI